MDTATRARLSELAARLRALHHAPTPLVLPNAWDVASARAVADAGFGAVATTSGGMAAALGWPDGEQTPPSEMFAAIGRITRVLDVPVTADIESGYGLGPLDLAQRLLEAGAVGCNLEDTDHAAAGHALRDPIEQARHLRDFKAATRELGVDVVVNARVDVFLHAGPDAAPPLAAALERGRLYFEAGADCVYPIGVHDEASIVALVKGLPGPINVIPSFRGGPDLARLQSLGVQRISFATRLHRAMLADLQRRLAGVAAGQDF